MEVCVIRSNTPPRSPRTSWVLLHLLNTPLDATACLDAAVFLTASSRDAQFKVSEFLIQFNSILKNFNSIQKDLIQHFSIQWSQMKIKKTSRMGSILVVQRREWRGSIALGLGFRSVLFFSR